MANAITIAEQCHVVNGLAPVDIAGAANSDVISMANHSHATVILQLGVTGGASTVTVTACDDATPSNETAIAFDYYAETTAAGDTLGARTAATSSGFSTSTNDGVFYVIELEASQINAVSERKYFRVKCSDPTGATFASIAVVLSGSRFAGDQNPTAIV